MRYNPARHHRRSIRLRGYDYWQRGAYFVTICTQKRELFLQNEDVGRMVTNVWRQLESKYPQIRLDEFVVMPNHIHGIIVIDVVAGADQCVGADQRVCPNDVGGMGKGEHAGSPQQRPPQQRPPQQRPPQQRPPRQGSPQQDSSKRVALGSIIQWFKTMTTNYYMRGIRNNAWRPFPGRFWQRNYYERIIRNENEMNRIRQYITGNPARWDRDHNNPDRIEQKTSPETTP
ncbi:MAG: hypothetical protein E3J45_02515 [Candidatus Zixiibacteriota bacterium]|nr:MAG: hypothetical protein E3J45_02515 [candidate division Zixibacteria bacterium]